MSNPLTSGQLNALQAVVTTAEQIAATVAIDLDDARALLSILETFLAANHGLLASIEFSLQLDATSSATGPALNATAIRSAVAGQQPIIKINSQGEAIGQAAGSITFSKVTERTTKANGFELRYGGGGGYYFLGGRIIDEREFSGTGQRLAVGPHRRRPFSELDVLLNEHHALALKNEAQCRYWDDKPKRVLLCVPDKTETIFQRSLFSWLKLNVADALSVFAEPSGLGQDKTDINVVTIAGKHVIELKWLGKNRKRTTFSNPPRIDQGLKQVALYLQGDQDLVTGDLIVYDAREPGGDCGYLASNKHALCRDPRIIFLESLTPSVLAEQAPSAAGKPAKGKKAAAKKPTNGAKKPAAKATKAGGKKKPASAAAAAPGGPGTTSPPAKPVKPKKGTSP